MSDVLIRDKYNIIPVTMALLLHGIFVTALVFSFDLFGPVKAQTPLVIEATLVTKDELKAPPVVQEPDPEPESEPEPPPDLSEQKRVEAEEQMRVEEEKREQQRVRDKEAAEKKRKEEALRKKQDAEAEKKRKEEEVEKRRVAAEKKRKEDEERQRKENERLRKEALDREKAEEQRIEMKREADRLAAMNSGEMARYQFAIQQKIMRNWIAPASAQPGIECVVSVRQLRGGEVVSAQVGRCNGDAAVRRSIEAAVLKASPLPSPKNPNLFDPGLKIVFKPEE